MLPVHIRVRYKLIQPVNEDDLFPSFFHYLFEDVRKACTECGERFRGEKGISEVILQNQPRHDIVQQLNLVVFWRIERNEVEGHLVESITFYKLGNDAAFPLTRQPTNNQVAPCWQESCNTLLQVHKFWFSSNEALQAVFQETAMIGKTGVNSLFALFLPLLSFFAFPLFNNVGVHRKNTWTCPITAQTGRLIR